ncbi:MAG: helix-turn-helix domain-containing protein [Deltaproteobacteria bacterium]|nr:helix-turn-helix domain-containing protein [Deltaproteobacteria bacterium]
MSRSEGGEPSEVSRAYLTIKEAADVSRLGSSTIRLYIRKRELKAHKVGRRVIIKRTDLVKFLESRPIVILSD